ncbi:MAG: SpaA isopeptide-forming pilin-related protein [Oscillospiraceae bacterium]
MKKTRRIAAFIAAMAMATCAVAPSMMFASAADVNVKIATSGDTTFDGNTAPADNADDHTYTAYQIFTGQYDSESDEFKITDFGSDVNTETLLATTSAFMSFKKDDTAKTVGEMIAALPSTATNAQKAAAAAQALSGITSDSTKAQELATILANAVTGNGTGITASGVSLAEGYYVVKDDYTASTDAGNTPANNKPDAFSRFILRVNSAENTSGITIVPKKSYPEVLKKVKENAKSVTGNVEINGKTQTEDTTAKYNDVADYNIGDAVPFKLYGSMPATLSDYEHYYYKFTDTLGAQFDQPETVTVNVGTETLTFTKSDASKYYTIDTTHQKTYTYTSTEDSSEKELAITNTDYNCRVTYENHVLKVWFEDVRAYGVTADSIVTVSYSAVLNENAVIGLSGQENKVDLTYSNNPNFEYTPHTDTPDKPDLPESPDYPDTPDIPDSPDVPDKPDTPDTPDTPNTPQDKTPEDKVIVFTYEVDINKIDKTTKANLQGAKFVLSRTVDGTTQYAVLTDNKISDWISGMTPAGNNDTKAVTWTGTATRVNGTTATEPTVLESGSDGIFKIIGLDAGTYTLTELVAPAGYELPSTVTSTVVVTASTANNQSWSGTASAALVGLAGTVAGEDMAALDADNTVSRGTFGGLRGTITNSTTTTLPSTGGMGTKAFVAGGGLTALLAGVWLATKKRMGKED